MNQIEQIKKQLAEISPWPWIAGIDGNSRFYAADNHGDRSGCIGTAVRRVNHDFIAQSAKRIAALVEYVEAAEKFITEFMRENSEGEETLKRFRAARRKLGLE